MSLEYDFEKFCKKAISKYGIKKCKKLFNDSLDADSILEKANGFINPSDELLEELLEFLDNYFLNRDNTTDAAKMKKLLELEVGEVAGVLSKYKNTYWKYTKVKDKMKFNFVYLGRK